MNTQPCIQLPPSNGSINEHPFEIVAEEKAKAAQESWVAKHAVKVLVGLIATIVPVLTWVAGTSWSAASRVITSENQVTNLTQQLNKLETGTEKNFAVIQQAVKEHSMEPGHVQDGKELTALKVIVNSHTEKLDTINGSLKRIEDLLLRNGHTSAHPSPYAPYAPYTP